MPSTNSLGLCDLQLGRRLPLRGDRSVLRCLGAKLGRKSNQQCPPLLLCHSWSTSSQQWLTLLLRRSLTATHVRSVPNCSCAVRRVHHTISVLRCAGSGLEARRTSSVLHAPSPLVDYITPTESYTAPTLRSWSTSHQQGSTLLLRLSWGTVRPTPETSNTRQRLVERGGKYKGERPVASNAATVLSRPWFVVRSFEVWNCGTLSQTPCVHALGRKGGVL